MEGEVKHPSQTFLTSDEFAKMHEVSLVMVEINAPFNLQVMDAPGVLSSAIYAANHYTHLN